MQLEVFKPLSLGFVVLLSSGTLASVETFSVEVGGQRRVRVPNAQGVVLDSPELAEVQLLGAGQVQIYGRSAGKGQFHVWTRDGRQLRYALQVVAGKGAPARECDGCWSRARFGGAKIAGARCALPFKSRQAGKLFDHANDLLRRRHGAEAVRALEQVLRLEPEAATAHLFLGSAKAALKDQTGGARAFETFVLSCERDPRTPRVIAMLRELEEQLR